MGALRRLFLQSETPGQGAKTRESDRAGGFTEEMSPALHPARETRQRQCGLDPAESDPT